MNVMKNMEAIFLAAAFLTGVTSVATAASENARERYDAQVSVWSLPTAIARARPTRCRCSRDSPAPPRWRSPWRRPARDRARSPTCKAA